MPPISGAAGASFFSGLSVITASVVKTLQELGFEPFIVSGMASHGKATDEGQAELLAELDLAGKPVVAFDVDGTREVVLDGRNLASGIYFLRMETPEITQVRQITLLK